MITKREAEMLRMLADGMTKSEISRELGVSRQRVCQVLMHAVRQGNEYIGGRTKGRHYPRLAKYLHDNRMRQTDFAEAVKMSSVTLSKMLVQGHTPRYGTLKKIADFTGMSVDELMQDEKLSD